MSRALAKIEVEKEKALGRCAGAYLRLKDAQHEYEEALMEADRLGIGGSEIARNVGLTETAVRLFIKRRKAKL